jgi:dephospho-CoA kinase
MIVGLTGGIGSGKTTAAGFFKDLGIPIYIADNRAKWLMNHRESLKSSIRELLGVEAYSPQGLNRKNIANKVFSNKSLLQELNKLVHPVVDQDFRKWYEQQEAPYVIKEAAILYENGGYKKCDYMLVVVAPLSTRIQRVMQRDNSTEEEVLARIKSQWTDARKISMSDAVLENINLTSLQDRVLRIHEHLIVRVSRGW